MKYINLQMAQVIIFALKYILYLIYCRGILCNVVACLSSGMQPIKDDRSWYPLQKLSLKVGVSQLFSCEILIHPDYVMEQD